MALYSVLSPCVFAYRCKRLQKELKKFFTPRSSASNGYGGVGKAELAFLQAKHRALLEEQHLARKLTLDNSHSKANLWHSRNLSTKSSPGGAGTQTPVRFTIGVINEHPSSSSAGALNRGSSSSVAATGNGHIDSQQPEVMIEERRQIPSSTSSLSSSEDEEAAAILFMRHSKTGELLA